MNLTVTSYLVYLVLALPLTVWVASQLSRNGQAFLDDAFGDRHGLATSINKLLVVGFYLINLGFVLLFLQSGNTVYDVRGLVERLSVKLGVVLLSLGVLHLFNVLVFNSIRHGQQRRAQITTQQELQRAYYTPRPEQHT